ncbi:MAG: galactosyldiacylglycerol synthase [Deltaproteobacteria bacterium]|nr:galactosyldiacylglycerol synthase [Deltaproteobacteria bacterium]
MQSRPKLLVLSVSAGAGHVRAAEALCAAAHRWHSGVEAVHVDVMDLVPRLFRKVYAESYLHVVEHHPALWGYLYEKTDHRRKDSKLQRLQEALERLNTRHFASMLARERPDAVICTHFLPAQLLSRLIWQGEFFRPVWVQVTDFDIHALWVHPHLSGYFAACDEVAWRMADRGIDRAAVTVTGIPILPAFGEPLSRVECAAELGLDPARTTLLMMSGGAGIGGLDALAERLLGLAGDFQVVALAGRNERLLADLQALAALHPGRLSPLGFTRTVERVMAASDLAITKPGGLTTSECLAMGLPMVVVSPIPGQEERNADYLLENGAALKAHDAAGLEFRVRDLLARPERLAELSRNAKALGRPDAARAVLARVLEGLG